MATIKFCPGCQAEIPEDSRFCPQCGAPQSLSCTACGHANPPGSRFCAQCGAKVGAPAAATPPKPAHEPPAPPRPGSAAERRQLTVMFCDLVGSTALSTRLDPEDLRDVIAAYHKCAAEMAARFSGFVAKYMGDGVLTYFGYPEAHEADAENALRAGLAIVEKVAAGAIGDTHHQVRIGIATGLVVVGELVGSGEAQERNVVGETPNLAARLQSAAAPNSVLIDSATRRLTGDLFDYEPIDPGALKGFDGPVAAWRVLRERSMQSRFEALRAANLAPLVGREEELELLLRRWQQAKEGEGRVVLLSGEPGIGKSRLTAALHERLAGEAPTALRYFCLPHTQGSALHPVISQLQHAAGFAPDDTPAAKRGKLEGLLVQGGGDDGNADLLAELMGLPTAQSASPMDPQRRRGQSLAALIGRLETLARQGPLLMAFEDVHWSDPTTLELLTLTIERMQALPVLLLITHRPDFQPPWAGQPHVTSMALNRLGRRERVALVGHVTGGKALPATLLEQIVERTDGVPLFVEELTKAVLESNDLDQRAQQVAVPTSLQASLMARVDRLGSAREVLQIGAAIGREFSYAMIAPVAGLPDAVLQDALARLTEAEMLLARGTPPNATYAFKHALVQDTAYSTMLRARRQALHGAIAQVLENRFQDTPSEVLAQQFEAAGRTEKAVQYWRQAGERDLRRFAMQESIAHYANALRLVEAMPEGLQRADLELGARLQLGMAQQISLGPTSKEALLNYERALALSHELPGKGRERFLASWGVWFNKTLSGQTKEALDRGEGLLAIARELDDPDLLLEAYHARTPGLMRTANFPAMLEATQEVMRLYDRDRHRDHAFFFGGHDSRVCAQSFFAMSLWAHGHLDQAQKMAWQCIDDARALGHTFSIAHSLNMGGLTHLLLDDVEACRAVNEELYPLAERNKFPWPLAYATFQRGWLLAQDGERDEGIAQMLLAADKAPVAVLQPMVLTLIAREQMRAGRLDDALVTIDRAMDNINKQNIHFHEGEITRLRGEILLAQSRDNAAEAEADFRRGLAVAAQQLCRPTQLRAAASLARLLRDSDRRQEARDVLAPIYAIFTEGLDRPDLRDAKALLAELG